MCVYVFDDGQAQERKEREELKEQMEKLIAELDARTLERNTERAEKDEWKDKYFKATAGKVSSDTLSPLSLLCWPSHLAHHVWCVCCAELVRLSEERDAIEAERERESVMSKSRVNKEEEEVLIVYRHNLSLISFVCLCQHTQNARKMKSRMKQLEACCAL